MPSTPALATFRHSVTSSAERDSSKACYHQEQLEVLILAVVGHRRAQHLASAHAASERNPVQYSRHPPGA